MDTPDEIRDTLIEEYLLKTFGGHFEVENVSVSVGTGLTEAAQGAGDRSVLIFINTSANTIYLLPDYAVSTTRGIVLNASGGFLSMNMAQDFVMPTLPWYAVASVAASTLTRISCRRYRRG